MVHMRVSTRSLDRCIVAEAPPTSGPERDYHSSAADRACNYVVPDPRELFVLSISSNEGARRGVTVFMRATCGVQEKEEEAHDRAGAPLERPPPPLSLSLPSRGLESSIGRG
jgi:hypothetical protein